VIHLCGKHCRGIKVAKFIFQFFKFKSVILNGNVLSRLKLYVDYQVKLKSHIQTQPKSPILLQQLIITTIQLFTIGHNAKGLAHLLFSKIKQLSLFVCKYLLPNKRFRSMKLKFTRPLFYNIQWAPDGVSHD
jgi:hypothetical protein